jgi:ubiquinone/menaquinone biosynthesis C-methylase UbiE
VSRESALLSEEQRQIRRNVRGSNRIARIYDDWHPEIFTQIEQCRLRESLEKATVAVGVRRDEMSALDFGCGSGNLTRHLLELGMAVTAADVSERFLRIVTERWGSTGRCTTVLLNGRDLRQLRDASFDIVAVYSVLHHLPDYLGTLDELARVLAPGGVLYLDHEASDGYWLGDAEYEKFLSQVTPQQPNTRKSWTRFLKPRNYMNKARAIAYVRYHRLAGHGDEGDIHIYHHDHIEWDKVRLRLESNGLQLAFSDDYLLYRAHYDLDLYDAYRDRCSDVHCLAMRKS